MRNIAAISSISSDCPVGEICLPREDPATQHTLLLACQPAVHLGAGETGEACFESSSCTSGVCLEDSDVCYGVCASDTDCSGGTRCYPNQFVIHFDHGTPDDTLDDTYDSTSACLPDMGASLSKIATEPRGSPGASRRLARLVPTTTCHPRTTPSPTGTRFCSSTTTPPTTPNTWVPCSRAPTAIL